MPGGRPPSTTTASMRVVETISPTRILDDQEAVLWLSWLEVVRLTRPFLSTDAPLLTMLVELECRKAMAMAALKKVDPYCEGRRHPALTDLDNIDRNVMSKLRELGLTPASAKNVRSEKRSKEGDKLKEFLS
jgi:cobalamin biosynthesis protein CbiG